MVVIEKCLVTIDLSKVNLTSHIQSAGRSHRKKYYEHLEKKRVVNIFWVDRGHKNGAELHVITEDSIILIFNEKTKKLCTVLIARPGQIERYYSAIHEETPTELIVRARLNKWIEENY